MRAVLALVITLAACSSEPTCVLEDVLTDRVGAQELEDCGAIAVTAPVADAQAAHDCVIAAQAAERPFRVVIEAQGRDSQVKVALIGITEGGTWRTYQLAYDSGDDMPTTVTFSCTSIAESSPCDDTLLHASLCLECAGVAVVASCPAE